MNTGTDKDMGISGGVSGWAVQAGSVRGGVHLHPPSSPVPVPRQLPPVPASFAGRETEITELDRLLSPDGRRRGPGLVVLVGPGGVGKSALAVRWLQGAADRFPDGQLVADLCAFGDGPPAGPGDVLAGFLRALGIPSGDLPAALAEQVALYRSLTAGKAIAILADDAGSAAQVRPLLPASPHSVVIVTSRWRLGGLALDGAQVVDVDPLDTPGALRLLSRTVGEARVTTELPAARALAELCGGLPIALCVAAGRLSTRPRWPIARMVRSLSDERQRLAALAVADSAVVQAGFDASCAELGPATARVYRLLGLHPGRDLSAAAAAALLALPRAEAEDRLEELVEASLLMDAAPDHYRFHDLARLHARQWAERAETGADREAAERRMVGWYLDHAVAADHVVLPARPHIGPRYARVLDCAPRFGGARPALDWLERELGNLCAIVDLAADRRWWDEAWQLCEALWGLLVFRRHRGPWVRTHERGIDAARQAGNPRAEARLRVQLGYAHLSTGQPERARPFFAGALGLARATGDRAMEATALEHLGLACRASGEAASAMRCFTDALAIAEALGQPRAAALHLRRLGEALCDQGRDREALPAYERAAALALEVGDTVLHARALTRLGAARGRLGDREPAVDVLHRVIAVLGEHGADHYRAEALEALADVHDRAGDTAGTRTLLRQALATYEFSGGRDAERVRSRLSALGESSPAPTE
ncbi:Tfp pilus assembly protein PilF [Prauserella shujinwangii]|uniref:Tfp pilus assembly protein PilF n=1 Tax=Prauserella shujinwangii TaxID=1453103 RepID=A0A2T0LKZ5_9PSEU|nr:tetratricopeptide repeat protein [Prauserella shujinwangii]PRX43631.1 Tfp pilus assembly protein PilF [Prauserella shujinwangii]